MAKQRKRQQRRNISDGIAAAPVVLVELAKHHNSPDSAAAEFFRIGLISGALLERPCCGSSTFFAAFRVPSELPDCAIRTFAGQLVAYTHGTDCNLSRWVARDMGRGDCAH